MAVITLRSVKGEPLTHTEVDDNFSNLNTELGEKLTSASIGVSVQAYDADTAKLDLAQTFSAEQTFTETKSTVYQLTGTEINPANGAMQYKTLAAITTFTEVLESGQSVVLKLDGGSTYTVTWPTMTWVTSTGNTAPTLTANDVIVLFKIDTTLYGAYVGSYT